MHTLSGKITYPKKKGKGEGKCTRYRGKYRCHTYTFGDGLSQAERSEKRAQLIEKAKRKALELGANAILGMRLETSQSAGVVGPDWYERVEMVLCGTAVKY